MTYTVTYDNPVYAEGEPVHFSESGVTLENGKATEMDEVPADVKDNPNVTVKGKKTSSDK